jgi:hypothetical protein
MWLVFKLYVTGLIHCQDVKSELSLTGVQAASTAKICIVDWFQIDTDSCNLANGTFPCIFARTTT